MLIRLQFLISFLVCLFLSLFFLRQKFMNFIVVNLICRNAQLCIFWNHLFKNMEHASLQNTIIVLTKHWLRLSGMLTTPGYDALWCILIQKGRQDNLLRSRLDQFTELLIRVANLPITLKVYRIMKFILRKLQNFIVQHLDTFWSFSLMLDV